MIDEKLFIYYGIIGLLLVLAFILVMVYIKKKTKIRVLFRQNQQIHEEAEKLMDMNKKLMELDRYKEEMIYMVVHDLKNYLNVILLYSEEFFENSMEIINQSGWQMLNQVSNFLDVHKFQKAGIQLDLGSHKLLKVVEAAIGLVRFQAEKNNITIVNNIPAKLTTIMDSTIIQRVFQNLLTNAIKFSPNNGKITIKVVDISDRDMPSENKNNKWVRISVSDEGETIPKEDLSSIFEKSRLPESRVSGIAGVRGLGLIFCKLAVESHNGEIGANPGSKKGTTIWFTLKRGDDKIDSWAEEISGSHDEEPVIFSHEEKELLAPFIEQFKRLEVYEISDLRKVLRQIEIKSNSVKQWKKQLQNAVETGNEKRYKELVLINSLEEEYLKVDSINEELPDEYHYRILVVDDQPDNATLIVNILEDSGEPYKLYQAIDGKAACKIAEKILPDLIIMDWDMPEMSGIEAVKQIKSNRATRDIQVIMATGIMTSPQNLRTALSAGAVDYIRKPIEKIALSARVYSTLLLGDSYKEIKRKKDQLEKLNETLFLLNDNLELKNMEFYQATITDSLTLVHNRPYLIEALSREFSKSRRYGLDLSCIMIDIDHFKEVNNKHGRHVGDYVLKEISLQINDLIRQEDLFGRYSGEKFLFILPNSCEEKSWIAAERIRHFIENSHFSYKDISLKLRISLGVADIKIGSAKNPDELINRADEALDQAKRTGGNRTVLYSSLHSQRE